VIGFRKRYSKTSYSQVGEDLIIQFVLKALGKERVYYLDIGTHDPVKFNNTYGLYLQGGSGICVEPNPELNRRIRKTRPRDKCVNSGVGPEAGSSMKFYVMKPSTLSTFSSEEAERLVSYGKKLVQTLEVPVITVSVLLDKYCERTPNFVSIDCEGMDDIILRDFPFDSMRPEVFCVETITYREDGSETKRHEIIDLMEEKGYMVFADTYINTIFIDRGAWRGRPL